MNLFKFKLRVVYIYLIKLLVDYNILNIDLFLIIDILS